MKRLSLGLMLLSVLLFGCGKFMLKDNVAGNSLGYVAGKGVGIVVNKRTPKSVPALEKAFDEFMVRTANVDMISPEDSMALYTTCILILSLETKDPYGIIGDMTFFLSQFGAKITPVEGKEPMIIGLRPIPKSVYRSFELGYDSGKIVATRGG